MSDDTEQTAKPMRIDAGSVEIDNVPYSEEDKMDMLRNAFMPILFAFDGMSVTLSVELTPTKHPDKR